VLSLLFVIGSGLTHALWNLLAKQSEDKAVFLWAMYIPSTIVLLPFVWPEMTGGGFSGTDWLFIVLSMTLQSVYALLLAITYKKCDLSQTYPLMRGVATLLAPIFGVWLLHESLPALGWIGIACLLLGFVVMSGWITPAEAGRRAASAGAKPTILSVIIGLCTACYTLVDKVNVQTISPLALLVVTNIGFILGLSPAAAVSGRITQIVFRRWGTFAAGAVLSPGSYLLFLYAMQHADVAYIAPLREIGIVFGVLLGLVVLKETHGKSRLAGSAIILAGIFLIALTGK
jgi:drug/metabolite transporter (DMT)-like permease